MRKNNNAKFKLNIACGKNKKPGFLGVDIWEGADIVVNLEKFPWPFETSSVDKIFCSHYIEHTPDLISFANELHRIMKVGAKAEIIAPYYSSIRAWQDPTHLRAISENTFLYFNKKWREINRLDHYQVVADFDFECNFILNPHWQDKPVDEIKFAIKHYINVVSDIHVILTKRGLLDNDLENKIKKAETLWETGKKASATKICREIVANGGESLEVYLMLGEYALLKGALNDAALYFRQAVLLDEESIEAHVGLVRSFKKSGCDVEAEEYLLNLANENPELANLVRLF